MEKNGVIGIDIGGTYTKYGIVDRGGNIVAEGYLETEKYDRAEDFVKELHERLNDEIVSGAHDIVLHGVGVGAPNGNYYTGSIEFAPNLQWKGVIRLTDLVEKIFQLPSVLTNDANAAAIGEMLFGDAMHMNNFLMITLGTGLGSGLVVDGELVYGHDGFAGELGHINMVENGRMCGCGNRGCLETYVSATGIIRTVFELLASETDESPLRDSAYNDLEAVHISQAADNGDPIARKAFELTGHMLGRALAITVAHTSPEAIFLFGGLAKAGKWIFDPTRISLEDHLLPIYRNKVKLLPSALLKKNIAVLGAAALMWKKLDMGDR
jgi:glucokinase